VADDLLYLGAALAVIPVSYGLIRLLLAATLWLFGDLLATPEPCDAAGDDHPTLRQRISSRQERRRRPGRSGSRRPAP
jgi:hypothetical protein